MENYIKKNIVSSIIAALVFLIIGILMVCNPNTILTVISYCIGTIFLLIGFAKIINYLINKNNTGIVGSEFVFGIVAIALGIFTITCSSTISAFFRIIIGIWIICSGISRIYFSMKIRSAKISIWPLLFVIAIIMISGGIYVVLNSGTLVVSLGVIIIIYSIMDLLEGITIFSNINSIM